MTLHYGRARELTASDERRVMNGVIRYVMLQKSLDPNGAKRAKGDFQPTQEQMQLIKLAVKKKSIDAQLRRQEKADNQMNDAQEHYEILANPIVKPPSKSDDDLKNALTDPSSIKRDSERFEDTSGVHHSLSGSTTRNAAVDIDGLEGYSSDSDSNEDESEVHHSRRGSDSSSASSALGTGNTTYPKRGPRSHITDSLNYWRSVGFGGLRII